jgi:hypothetical protein
MLNIFYFSFSTAAFSKKNMVLIIRAAVIWHSTHQYSDCEGALLKPASDKYCSDTYCFEQ